MKCLARILLQVIKYISIKALKYIQTRSRDITLTLENTVISSVKIRYFRGFTSNKCSNILSIHLYLSIYYIDLGCKMCIKLKPKYSQSKLHLWHLDQSITSITFFLILYYAIWLIYNLIFLFFFLHFSLDHSHHVEMKNRWRMT